MRSLLVAGVDVVQQKLWNPRQVPSYVGVQANQCTLVGVGWRPYGLAVHDFLFASAVNLAMK